MWENEALDVFGIAPSGTCGPRCSSGQVPQVQVQWVEWKAAMQKNRGPIHYMRTSKSACKNWEEEEVTDETNKEASENILRQEGKSIWITVMLF